MTRDVTGQNYPIADCAPRPVPIRLPSCESRGRSAIWRKTCRIARATTRALDAGLPSRRDLRSERVTDLAAQLRRMLPPSAPQARVSAAARNSSQTSSVGGCARLQRSRPGS